MFYYAKHKRLSNGRFRWRQICKTAAAKSLAAHCWNDTRAKNQRRYHVTPKGRRIFSGVLASQYATLQQLNTLTA
jgi:hypothetical protein